MRIVELGFSYTVARYSIRVFHIDARALFERVVGSFPADKARPLWERWARYVYQFGDLDAAQKLEKRIAEVYATGQYVPLHSCDSSLDRR